ncbi:MAG: hypothetical protein LH468_10645 [Nocardioides sp.]|nr:hypothetical protein [Nocardioides sp.]
MIGYYVHHQGRGHLHRALTLVGRLRALGHDVDVLSSLPPEPGHEDHWVRLPLDDAPPHLDPAPSGALHWVPLHHDGLRERSRTISAWIGEKRPRLLVSDVSQEVTLLARLHGVPVLSVVLPGRRDDPPHELGFRVSRRLVGFWPDHADQMLRGVPPEVRRRLVTVGALSRYAPVDGGRVAPGERLAVVLAGRGGAAWTDAELDRFEAAAPGWRLVRVGGSGRWVHDPWSLLSSAAVVVTHAGQNALAEVAATRVPAIVVPAPRPFDEQLTTAAQLRIGDWPCLVESSLAGVDAQALLDRAGTLDGARWSSWCDGLAAERFVAVVQDVLRETAPEPAEVGR